MEFVETRSRRFRLRTIYTDRMLLTGKKHTSTARILDISTARILDTSIARILDNYLYWNLEVLTEGSIFDMKKYITSPPPPPSFRKSLFSPS